MNLYFCVHLIKTSVCVSVAKNYADTPVCYLCTPLIKVPDKILVIIQAVKH